MQRVYLDWNATAPIRPEAVARMVEVLSMTGNPSSVHAEGRAVRGIVETARRAVASLAGAAEEAVTFTSGGTEAAAAALMPGWLTAGRPRRLGRLLLGATEHACMMAGGRFPAGARGILPVDEAGRLDLAALAEVLVKGEPALVAVQAANNETGVMQPIADIARIVHAHDGVLVCDAVQAAGRVPIDIGALGADALILSAHKIGGPQGVGALVLSEASTAPSEALIGGGGQEFGRRAGTEAVAAIAGFGVAASLALAEMADVPARLAALRDGLERQARARVAGTVVFGAQAARLPNTSLFGLDGVPAATLLMALDLAGVAVSSGAACSSGKVKRSHVLDAMRVPPGLAASAIRVSLGRTTGEADRDRFLEAFEKTTKCLYRRDEASAA